MAAVVNAARARLLAAVAAAMHPAPAVAAAVAARAAARVGVPRHRHAVVHAHQPVAAATKAVVLVQSLLCSWDYKPYLRW